MASPNPPTSNVSDAEIVAFLDANRGMSDKKIRQAMDQYGVNIGQMARAAGMNYGDVQDRYNKAFGEIESAPTNPSSPRPVNIRPTDLIGVPPEMEQNPMRDEQDRYRPGPYAPDKKIPDYAPDKKIPRSKMFDMEDYMTMGKVAQMGYKKGGAVKAASSKSSGYADKSGRLNLGSSRVSTAVKNKKAPNF